MRTINRKVHSAYRLDRKKINGQSKERLIILQKIWRLIVLNHFLTLLILILDSYLKRF